MPLLSPQLTRFQGQITRHIERSIGPSPMVFHEIVSAGIHLDLHVVPPLSDLPTPEHPHGRDFYTLVTSGLSSRPMCVPAPADPDALECPRRVELMVSLPADWPGLRPDGTFVPEYMLEEANWWPIRWLKMLARMAHEQGTFWGAGQVIPNGAHAERYAENTKFNALMLLPSVLHPKAQRLVVHDDLAITFLALWPLYPEEMAFQARHGAEETRRALACAGVTDRVDIRRKCTAAEPVA